MSDIIYHASPSNNLPYIEPRNEQRYVYATQDLIVAYTFAHRSGRGHILDMWRDQNGVFTLTEKVKGAFNWRYRESEGYVYSVNKDSFTNGTWPEEMISDRRIDIISVDEVKNVRKCLLDLQRNGQLNINLLHRIPTEYELFNIIKHWYHDPRENPEDAIAFGETFYPNFRRHFN